MRRDRTVVGAMVLVEMSKRRQNQKTTDYMTSFTRNVQHRTIPRDRNRYSDKNEREVVVTEYGFPFHHTILRREMAQQIKCLPCKHRGLNPREA